MVAFYFTSMPVNGIYPHWYSNELTTAKQEIKTYCFGTMSVSCPETVWFSKNNYNTGNYIEKRKEIESNKSYRFVGSMALKREAFKHENEVRLLVCLKDYTDEISDIYEPTVLGFDIEPENFIKSVTFDPRADEWFVNAMKKYCNSKGLHCNVAQSDLYKKDFFDKAKIIRKYELAK